MEVLHATASTPKNSEKEKSELSSILDLETIKKEEIGRFISEKMKSSPQVAPIEAKIVEKSSSVLDSELVSEI